MHMKYIQTYQDIRIKDMDLERGLVEDGAIKHYKESQLDRGNNDHSRYWKKKKNVITDGATDTKHVQIVMEGPQESTPTYQQPQHYPHNSPAQAYQQPTHYQKNSPTLTYQQPQYQQVPPPLACHQATHHQPTPQQTIRSQQANQPNYQHNPQHFQHQTNGISVQQGKSRPRRDQDAPKCTFTPLGEPINVIF